MRRMIDNKKLREIEASGGTKWYKHDVNIKTSMGGMTVGIVFFSMFGDSLKDGELTSGDYPAIITSANGPSAPNANSLFPILRVNASNGKFAFSYLGTGATIQEYEFAKTSINSDVVTKI